MGETPKTDDLDGDEEFSLEDSVNIDVGQLIEELESGDGDARSKQAESARRQLERMLEEKRAAEDLMDFDDYELD